MDGGEEAKKQKKLGNWEKWKKIIEKIIEKIRDKRTVKKGIQKFKPSTHLPHSLPHFHCAAAARRVYEL
jgi:hypothetical protein